MVCLRCADVWAWFTGVLAEELSAPDCYTLLNSSLPVYVRMGTLLGHKFVLYHHRCANYNKQLL